ncbi:glycoside hydrolase, partial [Thraustotheca clavata]
MGGNTVWTVCNRRLLKDGSVFFIRGVDYQPTPITRWSGLDLLLQPPIWQRDLPLIRNMNANAIKVYDYRTGQAQAHLNFLDAAYNNGYNPLYTMFSVWVPPNLMSGYVPIYDSAFQTYVAAYTAMAAEVSCHPGTMGFVIGGEINFYPDVATPLFWQKFNQLAVAARTGMAIAGCPTPSVKILTSNFIDDYAQSVIYGEKYGAAIDIWGIDVYDNRISSAKVQAFAQASSRPYMFAEYGVSYATNVNEVYGQDLWNVELYLMSMATFLEANYMKQDGNNLPVLVGGFVFEYSDEWWKEGDPFTHNNAMFPSSIFPLGFNAEEHYGIFSVASTWGLDKMQPRTIAAQLSSLWSSTIDSQPYSCNNPSSLVFSSSPTSISSLDCNISSSAISMGISVYSDPICTHDGGAMGCRNSPISTCRLCQLFNTPQSDPYVNCPIASAPPASSCTNATFVCPNGMVLQANSSCQFDLCPSSACVVDDISLRQGLGSIFDHECFVNIQADGCDVFNRGCRLCRQPYSRNTIYADCPI